MAPNGKGMWDRDGARRKDPRPTPFTGKLYRTSGPGVQQRCRSNTSQKRDDGGWEAARFTFTNGEQTDVFAYHGERHLADEGDHGEVVQTRRRAFASEYVNKIRPKHGAMKIPILTYHSLTST
jgi:hypothetical protein